MTTTDSAPTVEPIGYKCKFTVSRNEQGIVPPSTDNRRVEFSGIASPWLLESLVGAIVTMMEPRGFEKEEDE